MAPSRRSALRAALGIAVVAALTACAAGPDPAPPTGVDELQVPTPTPDPVDFVGGVDNPWLPLRPGTEWVYRATGPEVATVTVTVASQTRDVAGVATTVVSEERTDAAGELVAETSGWYAQDRSGNVWLLGEEVSGPDESGGPLPAGSWEAGVDGARAGLAMPAQPRVGDGYQQQDAPGVAQDRAEVLRQDGVADVPYGDFSGLLVTERSSPLQPGTTVVRYLAEGVGPVAEEVVSGSGSGLELVTFTPG